MIVIVKVVNVIFICILVISYLLLSVGNNNKDSGYLKQGKQHLTWLNMWIVSKDFIEDQYD